VINALLNHLPEELRTPEALALATTAGEAVIDALDGVVGPETAIEVLEDAVTFGMTFVPDTVDPTLRAALLVGLQALVRAIVQACRPESVDIEGGDGVQFTGTLKL